MQVDIQWHQYDKLFQTSGEKLIKFPQLHTTYHYAQDAGKLNYTATTEQAAYVWQANESAKIGRHLKSPSIFQ